MSATPGSVARRKLSLHPVHSAKCSQTTGSRLSAVRALTILGTMVGPRPNAAAIPPQYFINDLLVISALVIESLSLVIDFNSNVRERSSQIKTVL
jgi:hypothetical protein